MRIIILLGIICAQSASAASLKREQLMAQLQIRADVLVMSADGKQIVNAGRESRILSGFTPEGKFKRDWSSSNSDYGVFKLRHEWTIDPNGGLKVRLEEFSEEELDPKTGTPKDFKNTLGVEEREVLDFSSVNYVVKAIKDKRVIIRFVPVLSEEQQVESIGKLKIMGRGITIYDSEGAVWANDIEMKSEYSAAITHRGTIALSFSPFRGSEAAGVANGKTITVRLKDYPKITLQAETDFVPSGMSARVHVKYLKNLRTTALNSIQQKESSDEKRFLEKLK